MAEVGSRLLQDKARFASAIGIGSNLPLDEAVVQALPPNITSITAEAHGKSGWSVTARLITKRESGEYECFFLKCVPGDLGKAMFEAEFQALLELRKVMPKLVIRPICWGKLKMSSPETYFLLEEFKQFTGKMPDPVLLGARVAELHRKSNSPTGMFGYQFSTFDGAKKQNVDWDPSWASFFAKLLKQFYELDTRTNGLWKELDEVFQRCVTHLIPRLLGILQSDGRTIKPCLIHGDMWEGNIGTDSETGEPWIFDPAVYYAHCEMELGIWTTHRHALKADQYKAEYIRNMERSEPAEEWDDRNRLYRTKTNFAFSADVPNSESRKQAYTDLKYLVEKYTPFE